MSISEVFSSKSFDLISSSSTASFAISKSLDMESLSKLSDGAFVVVNDDQKVVRAPFADVIAPPKYINSK